MVIISAVLFQDVLNTQPFFNMSKTHKDPFSISSRTLHSADQIEKRPLRVAIRTAQEAANDKDLHNRLWAACNAPTTCLYVVGGKLVM